MRVASASVRATIVDELGCHLRAADLVGVHAHRLQHDPFALQHHTTDLRFGHTARIGEFEVPLPQRFEPRQVRGRRDVDREERVAHRRGPHVHHLDARALLREQVVVLDHLVPARHLAVRTHAEAEELLRRGDGGGDDRCRRRRHRQRGRCVLRGHWGEWQDQRAECQPAGGGARHGGTRYRESRSVGWTRRQRGPAGRSHGRSGWRDGVGP